MIFDGIRRLFGGRREEMSDCERSLARIQEFLDGELPDEERGEVAEHFQVCARCYPHLKLEEEFREKVRCALAKPEVPDGLRNRVLELIAREEGGA